MPFSTCFGTGNWWFRFHYCRYFSADWKQTNKKNPSLFRPFQPPYPSQYHLPSSDRTQYPLEKSPPCFYGLLDIMKLFSPTFIHTLILMFLVPCMPGELNNVSVLILPSVCETFFSQVLCPINLAFNQSISILANKKEGFGGFCSQNHHFRVSVSAPLRYRNLW